MTGIPMAPALTLSETRNIRQLVEHFVAHRGLVSNFMNSLLIYINESASLSQYVHSIRSRVKDPIHLEEKLRRKLRKHKEGAPAFDITVDNLLTKVTDLAGIRILHLHTTQMAQINRCLRAIIEEQPIELVEGPFARTWDDEYRSFFKSIGIETQQSETMYTSVHYIVASKSRTTTTCEIQVRTLMEEVWGEVDHKINYPLPNDHVACKEQIRALARSTSSATRLVDAIFATVADFAIQEDKAAVQKKPRVRRHRSG